MMCGMANNTKSKILIEIRNLLQNDAKTASTAIATTACSETNQSATDLFFCTVCWVIILQISLIERIFNFCDDILWPFLTYGRNTLALPTKYIEKKLI